jgi:membrane protease YdiL (CAAX protease family)
MGDTAWVMLAGFVVAEVVSSVMVALRYPDLPAGAKVPLDALDNSVAALAQFAAVGLAVWLLVGRRGGGVRHDLGVVVRASDAVWLLAGAGCSLVLGVMSAPVGRLWTDRGHGSQAIGQAVKDSAGWTRIALVVVVVVIAPFAEEVVFRGILLRGAMRRMPAPAAVLVSGAGFGLVHLVDPTTFPSFPALMALGVVSACVAVRSGDLSRSVMLHAGFNMVGAVTLVLGVVR